jgi:DNA-binding NarL/FixJ family response regulator
VISVLIADDQELVRGGFRMILEAQEDIDVVGEAENGQQAVSRCIDLRMPVLDGIAATRRIVGDRLRSRVLVLTTFDNDETVYDAMRAGASGFLLKSTPVEKLIDGVRIVAAGDALLAPTITPRLVEEFVRRPRPGGAVPPAIEELTGREHEVLLSIARGLSNGEIAAQLVISEATVKSHVNRIFQKLDLRDRVQAVVLAYECGLVSPGVAGESP